MSVTVSKINDSTTSWKQSGGRAFDHYHRLDYSSHEVPTVEEHRALESKVSDCQQDISKIESKIIKSDQRLAEFAVAIPRLAAEVGNVKSQIGDTVRALNETGQLATAFKSVTDKHLANIQKAVDVLSMKIKDGERELKTKASEGLELLKKAASEITAKIREAEQTVSACAKKSKDDVAELGKIKEQAVSALKNATALVQKQLSEYITGEASRLNTIEQSVLKSVDSIKESCEKVAELQDATDRLESRLKLIEKEDTLGRLAVMEKNYCETLAACQDTLSAANYFRSVNRSFFSRLWWCLTGRCTEAQ